MRAKLYALTLAAFVGLALSATQSSAHDMAWPEGASRLVDVGRCAKGPCMRRTSFDESVPHRHVAPGLCEGRGAAGYRYGQTFPCAGTRGH